MGEEMIKVTRINLKTDCENRRELIDFCLMGDQQFLVIGWSYIYKKCKDIHDYRDFYRAVKDDVSRINHAFNVFWYTSKGDLFWTRDLEGNYWICRATGASQIKYDETMDIGAVVPVVAYKVGMQVPGQIKASFNRPRGGIAEGIHDEMIIEYSKYMYNLLSNTEGYNYKKVDGSILDNLPDFELEELVISYLQLKRNYYVLSNSIANKSTTIKIECEFIGRDKNKKEKAVVQVKGGKVKSIDAMDYRDYVDDGYIVYLYASEIKNIDNVSNCIEITRNDLMEFYAEYKLILPESITKWESLFL